MKIICLLLCVIFISSCTVTTPVPKAEVIAIDRQLFVNGHNGEDVRGYFDDGIGELKASYRDWCDVVISELHKNFNDIVVRAPHRKPLVVQVKMINGRNTVAIYGYKVTFVVVIKDDDGFVETFTGTSGNHWNDIDLAAKEAIKEVVISAMTSKTLIVRINKK